MNEIFLLVFGIIGIISLAGMIVMVYTLRRIFVQVQALPTVILASFGAMRSELQEIKVIEKDSLDKVCGEIAALHASIKCWKKN